MWLAYEKDRTGVYYRNILTMPPMKFDSFNYRSILCAFVFGLFAIAAEAQQCVLLQSEISAVSEYEIALVKYSDSLSSHAEQAAHAALFSDGRKHARTVALLAGEALSAAEDAVLHASEAQYHAEVCGLDDVVSHAITAESAVIDARDFAEKAYTNARKAGNARSLGDIWYYMRRSQQAARNARKASVKANYAALDAGASCTHVSDTATGRR